jgi:hypothetical protein
MEDLIKDGLQSLMDPPKEKMTKSELEKYCNDFNVHFSLVRDGAHIPIPNSRHSWPWQHVLDLLGPSKAQQVAGLLFHYGLNNSGFVPLLELYYLDEQNANAPTRVPDSIHQWTSTEFKKIKASELESLVVRYVQDVKVQRTKGAKWEALRKAGERPDPCGIWYPLEGKINVLMGDNNEKLLDDRHLVIRCIAAELTHSDMSAKLMDTKEYRHMLALHVAKPKWVNGRLEFEDQLDNSPDSGNFAMRAMDIGALCPPNCLK